MSDEQAVTVDRRELLLECPSTSWGIARDASGTLAVRCRGKACRTAHGKSVIHRFDLETGAFTTGIDRKPSWAKE